MLSSVILHNFKCWADERIDLGALTLLTGLNGAGKSTILQSLLVLRQSAEQGLLAQGRLAINGDLVTLGTGRDAFCEDAEDEILSIGLRWSDAEERRWSFRYDRAADVLEAFGETSDAQGGSALLVPARYPVDREGCDFFHLPAERVGPRVSGVLSDHLVRTRRGIGGRGELAGHFLAAHGRTPIGVPELAHPNAVSMDVIDQVEAWLGEVSAGARLHVSEHRDLDAVQIRYSFEGPTGGSNPYRATNVGFGLSYTLPILVATLAARPGSLVLVENPEAHLHPRGQVRIAELLATAAAHGVQVVVETHSDHVLNGVRLAVRSRKLAAEEASIHFFERRRSAERCYVARISPRIDGDGRLDPWPEGFFDEIERSLARLLDPRGRE